MEYFVDLASRLHNRHITALEIHPISLTFNGMFDLLIAASECVFYSVLLMLLTKEVFCDLISNSSVPLFRLLKNLPSDRRCRPLRPPGTRWSTSLAFVSSKNAATNIILHSVRMDSSSDSVILIVHSRKLLDDLVDHIMSRSDTDSTASIKCRRISGTKWTYSKAMSPVPFTL